MTLLGASATLMGPIALRYVHCQEAGIRRIRRGRRFAYLDANGARLTSGRTVKRIEALVIPPAWQSVWICSDPTGHLQATGIDARGRKQYRYHPRWTAHRNSSKFQGLGGFARMLPKIRRRVRADMALPDMPRDKVLACVVHLMDAVRIRVGNSEYARDNNSYGLTTIHNEHATVHGADIRFRFLAKSGKHCDTRLHDPAAARIVRKCQCLPGQELFAYLDERGKTRDVTSCDVNDYLHRITGTHITAKDFRTWGGTVVAAHTLLAMPRPASGEAKSPAALRRAEVAAVRAASVALCNTVATCRKYYVHPELAARYRDDTLERLHEAARASRTPREMNIVERAVAIMLRERVGTAATATARAPARRAA